MSSVLAELDDLAHVHHRDPGGEDLDDPEVVADEQAGEALLALQLLEQVEHLGLHRHVERRGRLVGDEQVGLRARARGRCRRAAADHRRARAGSGSGSRAAGGRCRAGSRSRVLSSLPRILRCRYSGSPIDSPTGSRGFSEEPGSWKTMPTRSRSGRRSLAVAPCILTPATSSDPPATGSRPMAARPIVVLPEPDSPTRPTTSPLAMRQGDVVDGAEDRLVAPLGVLQHEVLGDHDRLAVGVRASRGAGVARSALGTRSPRRHLGRLHSRACRSAAPRPAAAGCRGAAAWLKIWSAVPGLDDAAVLHHDDPVGHVGDDAHVVGDQHDAGVDPLAQVAHQLEDLALHGDVERRGRLVGDEELGLAGQRLRDHRALALTAGELVREGVEAALGLRDLHHA